jgi:hypothetical protein
MLSVAWFFIFLCGFFLMALAAYLNVKKAWNDTIGFAEDVL